MESNLLVPMYAAYAMVAVPLTVWIARTLFRNGQVFLDDVFSDARLAGAVNQLLVVGFYLLNLGYACLLMKADPATTPVAAVETLASKLGALLLTLGAVHFTNMYLFYRIRRRAQLRAQVPVAPQYKMDPCSR